MSRPLHHHLRSATKRGLLSLVIVSLIMAVGTAGIHFLEGIRWLKAFYLMSMIATGQGTMQEPQTDAGLVFVSVMAFVSVGTGVAALGFIFGPFFGRLWHIGIQKVEEEIKVLKEMKKQ